MAGITYRQLDYWARTGLVTPSLQPAKGSGTLRLYSTDDMILVNRIVSAWRGGLSVKWIRKMMNHEAVLRAGKGSDA